MKFQLPPISMRMPRGIPHVLQQNRQSPPAPVLGVAGWAAERAFREVAQRPTDTDELKVVSGRHDVDFSAAFRQRLSGPDKRKRVCHDQCHTGK